MEAEFLSSKPLEGGKNYHWYLCQFQVTGQFLESLSMLWHFLGRVRGQWKSQVTSVTAPWAKCWIRDLGRHQCGRMGLVIINTSTSAVCMSKLYAQGVEDEVSRTRFVLLLFLGCTSGRPEWASCQDDDKTLQRRGADPDPTGTRFFWGISAVVLRRSRKYRWTYSIWRLWPSDHGYISI